MTKHKYTVTKNRLLIQLNLSNETPKVIATSQKQNKNNCIKKKKSFLLIQHSEDPCVPEESGVKNRKFQSTELR